MLLLTMDPKTKEYEVPIDAWSMVEIDILSTDTFIQNDLSNAEIVIVVEKMLLHTGYIGIKQAQIFPTENTRRFIPKIW